MKNNKLIVIFGFALFAGFFGAGNLVLPPLLGFKAGSDWWLVALGFMTTATFIPLLALFGHAKLQGTILDFATKVSPKFSLLYGLCVLLIAISLPCPRTAAVTYEMSIQPYLDFNPLLCSAIFFGLVLLFALKRSAVINFIGKWLTPLIVLILLIIIVLGIVGSTHSTTAGSFTAPFIDGFLEGYQTYDAIAGILMGGIVVVSLNAYDTFTIDEKRTIIAKSGLIAMAGLFVIYVGLISLGALYNNVFDEAVTRTALLRGLSIETLGSFGTSFLAVLVGLACFTTAVAIVVSVGDVVKAHFKNSHKSYVYTVIFSCCIGVLVGQFDVHYIIDLALPALMFIYPITIVLILLNLVPEQWARPIVFKIVVFITFLFSIPDFLKFFVSVDVLEPLMRFIPFSEYSLGWVLPALGSFIICNLLVKKRV